MIKPATATIAYVIWREGRPRLVPNAAMRKMGFKTTSLKHDNGTWFTYEEAAAASSSLQVEALARKAQLAEGQKLKAILKSAAPKPQGRTLSEVMEIFFALPQLLGKPIIDGKKLRPALSPVTVKGYVKYAGLVERACARMDDEDTWHMPVFMMGPAFMQKLLDEIERKSGLGEARRARGLLSTVWSKVATKEPGVLKSLFTELDAMPTVPGRIRPWEPHEFWAMVKAAESMGRFDMADSFFWGVLHGDRQTDRLWPTVIDRTASHITLKHSKTGVITKKFMCPWLQQRFKASELRRKAQTVQWPQLIIDEKAGRPWTRTSDWYTNLFGQIRWEAAKAVPSVIDHDGHLGIRDQDLRDTNQTWLDRANVDPRTMQLIAGHSTGEKSAMQKRHYVATNQTRMDEAVMAISKMLSETAPKAMKGIEG